MAYNEKYLDVYNNLEFAIIQVYNQNKQMLDYDVEAAVIAVIDFYIAKERGREPRDFKLSDLGKQVYLNVMEMSESRLNNRIFNNPDELIESYAITTGEMIDCLKTIKGSVGKWTKRNGRQGYLKFVSQYV